VPRHGCGPIGTEIVDEVVVVRVLGAVEVAVVAGPVVVGAGAGVSGLAGDSDCELADV